MTTTALRGLGLVIGLVLMAAAAGFSLSWRLLGMGLMAGLAARVVLVHAVERRQFVDLMAAGTSGDRGRGRGRVRLVALLAGAVLRAEQGSFGAMAAPAHVWRARTRVRVVTAGARLVTRMHRRALLVAVRTRLLRPHAAVRHGLMAMLAARVARVLC